MRFDWVRFLRQHRIEFVTSGPNFSKRNAANIRCPFCGDSDPSQHMGLSASGWWGCLRNASHRGRSPVYLVQRLLGCSAEEARRITGGTEALAPTSDEHAASFDRLKALAGVSAPSPAKTLQLPTEFKPLLNGSPLAVPFLAYLKNRGYRDAQIKWLAENYKLHYATQGDFAYRIIIPIYDRYGGLLSWTARAINPDATLRYKTLRVTPNGNGPVARIATNSTILGLPVLWSAANPKMLVLVEGPFDALKVTAFGRTLGLYGASLFGLNVYPGQVAEVLELGTRFPQICLLIDEDAELQRLRILGQLSSVRVQPLKMPAGFDDPGALPPQEIVKLSLGAMG